jgi:hypothetical protein
MADTLTLRGSVGIEIPTAKPFSPVDGIFTAHAITPYLSLFEPRIGFAAEIGFPWLM